MMAEKILVRPTLDPDARVSTGVPGLDDMLEGGFPAGSLITLAGRPGTGKTIFGSQFLYQRARDPRGRNPEPRDAGIHRRRRAPLPSGASGRGRAGPLHRDHKDAGDEPPNGTNSDRHRESRNLGQIVTHPWAEVSGCQYGACAWYIWPDR